MDANRKIMNREQLFRDVFTENGQRIFRICGYFFIDPDDRKDACQESLIRIWQNLHSFKGNSSPGTWVYRVVVNTCLSYIRKDKRRNSFLERSYNPDNIDVAELTRDENPGMEEKKLAFLHRFLAGLNTADRTLVSLYLEGISTREMAEITGISEVNVRVKLHRIKEKIKTEWEDKHHGT